MRVRLGIIVGLLLMTIPIVKALDDVSICPPEAIPMLDERLGLTTVSGELVVKVDPDSIARRAGVRFMDFLGAFDGKTVRELDGPSGYIMELRETAMLQGALVDVWRVEQGSGPRRVSVALKLPQKVGSSLGMSLSLALLVTDVRSGGPASAAGIHRGEFIESIDGRHVAALNHMAEADAIVSKGLARDGEVRLILGLWSAVPSSASGQYTLADSHEVVLRAPL